MAEVDLTDDPHVAAARRSANPKRLSREMFVKARERAPGRDKSSLRRDCDDSAKAALKDPSGKVVLRLSGQDNDTVLDAEPGDKPKRGRWSMWSTEKSPAKQAEPGKEP